MRIPYSYRLILCLTGLAFLLGQSLYASPPSRPGDIFIAAGDPANDAVMDYGWGRTEGRPGTRIRWINKLEADVYVDIEEPRDMDFWLRGTPVFRLGMRQVVGIYVNLDFVTRWDLPYTIGSNDYHAMIPEKFLRAGKNRITLRLGYIMRPGNERQKLGMEVEHLILRPR